MQINRRISEDNLMTNFNQWFRETSQAKESCVSVSLPTLLSGPSSRLEGGSEGGLQHTPWTISHSYDFFSYFVSLAISFPVKKDKTCTQTRAGSSSLCLTGLPLQSGQSVKSRWLSDLKPIHRVLLREGVKADPLPVQAWHMERHANPGWPSKRAGLQRAEWIKETEGKWVQSNYYKEETDKVILDEK